MGRELPRPGFLILVDFFRVSAIRILRRQGAMPLGHNILKVRLQLPRNPQNFPGNKTKLKQI